MRILFISNLYPSSTEPTRAPYNEQLMTALVECGHTVQVIAPVPWFPGIGLAGIRTFPPGSETRNGIPVTHPRVFYTPRCFINRHHLFYRQSLKRHFNAVVRSFQPDHVIIGFAYPDAAAMAPLCRAAGLDYSVRINGSDFRVRSKQSGFRQLILDTLSKVPLILVPGQALRRDMTAAGLDAARIVTFNNGVDHTIFNPKGDHPETGRPRVLFGGNLVPVKAVDQLLEAWKYVLNNWPDANTPELVLAGDGPQRNRLETLARTLEITESLRFLGRVAHSEMAEVMRSATCLCLPSLSEGMPNVILEMLACGKPVVASDAGEMPYLIEDDLNGYIVHRKSSDVADSTPFPQRLARALTVALRRDWDSSNITAAMKPYTWHRAASTISSAIRDGSAAAEQSSRLQITEPLTESRT